MKILIAVLFLASTCLQAEDRDRDRGHNCSDATLRGSYGFTISGTRPSGPPPAPIEQFVGLAISHFDGEGHVTQPTGSSHGSISGDSQTDTGTGTYSLNPDCSGTMTLNLTGRTPAVTLRLWMVVVAGGKGVNLVVMTPTPGGTPIPSANLTVSNGRKIDSSDR
jgi:hypothetical protein